MGRSTHHTLDWTYRTVSCPVLPLSTCLLLSVLTYSHWIEFLLVENVEIGQRPLGAYVVIVASNDD